MLCPYLSIYCNANTDRLQRSTLLLLLPHSSLLVFSIYPRRTFSLQALLVSVRR